MREAVLAVDKQVRDKNIDDLTKEITEHFAEVFPEMEPAIKEAIYKLEKKVVRNIFWKRAEELTAEDLTK